MDGWVPDSNKNADSDFDKAAKEITKSKARQRGIVHRPRAYQYGANFSFAQDRAEKQKGNYLRGYLS